MIDYISVLYNTSNPKSKYFRWYQQICQRAKLRASTRKTAKAVLGYTEGHHIVPKCLCEDASWISDKQNLVYLSAREHYICHWLLTKVIPNNYKILYAFARMTVDVMGKRNLTSKQHARCRIAASLATSLKPAWNQGLTYKTGPCSDRRRTAITKARKNTAKIECQHCKKLLDPGNHRRFHGDLCKLNPSISFEALRARSECAKQAITTQQNTGTYSKPKPRYGTFTCPHCAKTGTNYGSMMRHHFARCKLANTVAASASDIVSSLSSSA